MPFTPGTLAYDLASAIDSSISGKSFGSTGALYSSLTGSGTLNAARWTGADDISFIGISNTDVDTRYGSTLIHPRIAYAASHTGLGTTSSVHRFGNGATGTVQAYIDVPNTDIRLILFTAPVVGVNVAPVIDSSWLQKLALDGGIGIPIVRINQTRQAIIHDLSGTLDSASVHFTAPTDAQRLAFSTAVIDKDSSGGLFGLLNGQLVLIGSTNAISTGASILRFYVAMAAMMNQLLPGAMPTLVDVSDYATQVPAVPFLKPINLISNDTGNVGFVPNFGTLVSAITDGTDPVDAAPSSGPGFISIGVGQVGDATFAMQSLPVASNALRAWVDANFQDTGSDARVLEVDLIVNGVTVKSWLFDTTGGGTFSGYYSTPPFYGSFLPTDVIQLRLFLDDGDAELLTTAKVFEARIEYTPVGEIEPDETAAGDWLTQQDIIDFLSPTDAEILSQQDPDSLTVSVPNMQRAIDKAEAHAKSILGNTFAVPLAVGGVALISATASLAYPQLVAAGCQYVGFWLNKWRAIDGLGANGKLSQAAIDNLAAAWEADADNTLRMMVRWANGYSDGLSVDLDMLSTAPRLAEAGGIPAIQMIVPRRFGFWPARCW